MHRNRLRVVAGAAVAAIVSTLAVVVGVSAPASALSGSEFDPGAIISDAAFFDANSMGVAEIQAFLEARVPNCVAGNGYPCLKNYSVDTFSRAAVEPGHCAAYPGAAAERASTIIFKVAQACGISPKVLLVLLQKEQGLITATSPTERQYRVAMGYGCPDTAPCDAQFYGFYNQVYKAAWQFRQYTNYPARAYRIGNVPVQYSPNAACGAPVINIKNQATANLYNYTPYQPNAAALANLGGTGDGCSSYGNRNFWVYYNNWFGSPTADGNPLGYLDSVSAAPGGVKIVGWALDLDSPDPIQVHIYVNGVGTAIIANSPRTDIAAIWPAMGPNHGISVTVPITAAGVQTVCVYGINVGVGQNSLYGCRDVAVYGGSPVGSLDSVTLGATQATVTGWALDPDTAGPTQIHVYVDSVGTAFTADDPRSDIAAVYPTYGANHGFSRTVAVPPGTHSLCVYGINVAAPGANVSLGCRTVTMRTGSPLGSVDSITGGPGSFTVTGWSFDPDTSAAIPVHVYSNGVGVAGTADQARPDVAAVYPGYGTAHGYSITVPASPGNNTVCAYGIDSKAPGGNTTLGCRTVVGMSGSPIGSIDSIVPTSGGFALAGWAFDPDTASPIAVHVYVDATGYAFTANGSRADVGAVYKGYGDNHGYTMTVPAAPGTHSVCVYGINAGAGGNALLGCRSVTL